MAGNKPRQGNTSAFQAPPLNSEDAQALADRKNLSPEAKKGMREERLKKRREDKERWNDAALHLTQKPAVSFTGPRESQSIKANFFKVTFDKSKQLFKYRIDLGLVNQKSPTKRDLKRFLIGSLLDANKPDSQFWACDYHSHIISVLFGLMTERNMISSTQLQHVEVMSLSR